MSTYILVHGGWQGGWVYQTLARLLRHRGHEVYAPTLTGLGERSHLADRHINLETHIADVVNLIVFEGLENVILVGHSYGGMVITGVADRLPDRLQTLVYLDAIIPKGGDTLLNLRPQFLKLFLEKAAGGEGHFVAPNQASAFDARLEFWPLLDAKTTPHPLACFTQALSLTGAHLQVTNRVYIYAKGGNCDEPYRRLGDEDGARVHEVANSGHSLTLDQPEELCRLLDTGKAHDV